MKNRYAMLSETLQELEHARVEHAMFKWWVKHINLDLRELSVYWLFLEAHQTLRTDTYDNRRFKTMLGAFTHIRALAKLHDDELGERKVFSLQTNELSKAFKKLERASLIEKVSQEHAQLIFTHIAKEPEAKKRRAKTLVPRIATLLEMSSQIGKTPAYIDETEQSAITNSIEIFMMFTQSVVFPKRTIILQSPIDLSNTTPYSSLVDCFDSLRFLVGDDDHAQTITQLQEQYVWCTPADIKSDEKRELHHMQQLKKGYDRRYNK